MKALVTGAGGFVGSHLVSHLEEFGDEVVQTSLLFTEEETNQLHLDVSDSESCEAAIVDKSFDVIYHLAGIAFVPEAERNFNLALEVNVAGSKNVLEAASKCAQPPLIIAVSTAEVYGQIKPEDLPMVEELRPNPKNMYALSKLMMEDLCHLYMNYRKVPCIVMRPFNHIGPGQRPEFVASSFAFQLAQIKHNKLEPVIKVGNLVAKRDFTDVRDIVRGYRLAAQKGIGASPINLCSGRSVSIQSILDTLIEISELEVEIVQDPDRLRASEIPEIRGSYVLANNLFGWTPEIELRESLEAIYRSWL